MRALEKKKQESLGSAGKEKPTEPPPDETFNESDDETDLHEDVADQADSDDEPPRSSHFVPPPDDPMEEVFRGLRPTKRS